MMTTAEKWLVLIGLATLGVAIATSNGAGVKTNGGQRQDQRGQGDDQYKEGLGLDVRLQLGAVQPDDHTRWHYGGGQPGEALPTNWSRHRLAYPRRGGQLTEYAAEVPLNTPAFPRNDAPWFYCPPADEGI
jgi:hypothetical protein